MESDSHPPSADLYALLNVSSSATEDEIQKSFKWLSNSYHPDKLHASFSPEDREHIQHVFLEIKRAKDILIDPVLRLAYDDFGDEGVDLIRRIQQHQRDQESGREAQADMKGEEDDEDDYEEEMEASLYTKLERLLRANPLEAKQELQRFMAQHDYHTTLTDQNQVQLSCNVEFPPVVDLKNVYFHGRDYLKYAQQHLMDQARAAPPDERDYFKQRLKQEKGLVDYQINRIRESQKGSVGFTLSSLQPRKVATMSGQKVRPKWSMAMGTSTEKVYPGVAEIAKLVGKDEKNEKRHSASVFINAVYQPIPDAQVNLTANLSNDHSHQVSRCGHSCSCALGVMLTTIP
jgi:curved DNA-binding protein CbpA